MKKVELTHAEVIKFVGTDDVIKEYKSEKGIIINFNVRTRINDRVENSPFIFERCVYFADSEDKLKQLKGMITLGSILDIKGSQDRSSYEDKKTKEKKYSDSLRIREINPITINKPAGSADDDLPF